ncbi:MAG: bifunctional homocysteine S-methyltransferase/methylenetetrahydrofolate reductase [Polyangiaceae bacterium]|nr:bifunctional homocysteine S-methyltransferase/methylenetetrahydrofolate reductase [Polyangiaceae bacterium]
MESLAKCVAAKTPLVLDGAMGTQIYERGVLFSSCFEELNVSKPELIQRIHEDYIAAGAQIIETNSFGANALRLDKHGYQNRVREFNEASVRVAKLAAGDRAYVAGAIGPSGYFLGQAIVDDLRKVKGAFREQADALVGAGVDAVVVETMRQSNELVLGIEAAQEAMAAANRTMPIFAFATLDENLRTADGLTARQLGELARTHGVALVGVNCSDGPMSVLSAIEEMRDCGVPLGAVPNAGVPRRVDERLVYISTPEYFGVYARRLFKLGVTVVGGCCGTTPEHIRRVAAAGRMASVADGEDAREFEGEHDSIRVLGAAPGVETLPIAERSSLGAKLGKSFLVSVEVNPPVGLDPSKAIAAATMLKEGGVDVINIADGARAQARMSNLALAHRIQSIVGMETILHVCGRDRNLLATLAHLLGAYDLGLRNLVIITGDPPKMGDFPDATPVYDLDSIGMLKMASRLNRGIDPSGKPLGQGTGFVLATGAEPAALNYDREIKRLAQKIEAGAELIMTQPVYDPATLKKFLNDIAPFKVPVMVGLLPLASFRNAEFLHNEVPGMQIPEATRERMRKVGSGGVARKEGVAIAREMLSEVRSMVAGAYIMPPLERYELALEVMDGFTGAVG